MASSSQEDLSQALSKLTEANQAKLLSALGQTSPSKKPLGTLTIKLANGAEMPAIAFGCAFYDVKGMLQGADEARVHVPVALESGYRHLDTARSWGTERSVGDTLREQIAAGKLSREDLFITAKVCHPMKSWVKEGYICDESLRFDFEAADMDVKKKVAGDIQESLKNLGVDFVDVLLMHWPGNFGSQDASGNREVRKLIYEVFEAFYQNGLAKAIGVCNFSAQHIEDLIADTSIGPMVAHFESHPYGFNEELLSFCQKNSIAPMAHQPFGGGGLKLFEDPVLMELASKYDRNIAQLILRWLFQRGVGAMPRSSSRVNMASNLELDFAIESEDMERINGLNRNHFIRPDPKTIA